jgi:hypothetical protein
LQGAGQHIAHPGVVNGRFGREAALIVQPLLISQAQLAAVVGVVLVQSLRKDA